MAELINAGAELLARYQETGDKALRNEVVLCYGNLVKYTALSLRNMYQKYAEHEDIVNEGMLALMAAADSFDPSKGVKFESYASMKIRGAIIDYIRKQDFIPRSVRKFARDLETAYRVLNSELRREPTSKELAEYLDIPEEKLLKSMAESSSANTLSFEEMLYEGDFDIQGNDGESLSEAERNLDNKEKKELLAAAIDKLKEQERTVVALYYYEKLKFSDIGKVLGVSESRVCQIHTKAMVRLKNELQETML